MRRGLEWQLALFLAVPTLGHAAVEVQLRAGKIDVKTSGAPLAEVLAAHHVRAHVRMFMN